MDKSTRNAIERATQQARKLLDDDFSSQLEGTFDVLRSGVIAPSGGVHLTSRQQFQRGKIVLEQPSRLLCCPLNGVARRLIHGDD